MPIYLPLPWAPFLASGHLLLEEKAVWTGRCPGLGSSSVTRPSSCVCSQHPAKQLVQIRVWNYLMNLWMNMWGWWNPGNQWWHLAQGFKKAFIRVIERRGNHHTDEGKSTLWEGHSPRAGESRLRKMSWILAFQFTSLALTQGRTDAMVASQSLRHASVGRAAEGGPACGLPLFFPSPTLPYLPFIFNLGNVLILNLIQKDINSQFGVTSLNLWTTAWDRWHFLFLRILTSKIFLSCFKLEVDINGKPSKDLYRKALLKR